MSRIAFSKASEVFLSEKSIVVLPPEDRTYTRYGCAVSRSSPGSLSGTEALSMKFASSNKAGDAVRVLFFRNPVVGRRQATTVPSLSLHTANSNVRFMPGFRIIAAHLEDAETSHAS